MDFDYGPITVSGGPLPRPINKARVIARNSRLYVFSGRRRQPRTVVFDAPAAPAKRAEGGFTLGDLTLEPAGCTCSYVLNAIASSILVRDADRKIADGSLQIQSPEPVPVAATA